MSVQGSIQGTLRSEGPQLLSSGLSQAFKDETAKAFQHVPRVSDAGPAAKNGRGDRKINDRALRACTTCHLLKTLDQFMEQGCTNCPRILQAGSSKDDVAKATTTNFEGMIAVCTGNRQDSWVCRWLQLDNPKLAIGAYCVSCSVANEHEYDYDDDEDEEEEEDDDIDNNDIEMDDDDDDDDDLA
eukprot:TRINITY_DN18280_c0_g1_i1.p1 TRINITY_DN18280_c0_g1~~TRINITY_DN18280_c0_g1_i1.p1  ORF type:complete len:185 (+),score=40.81 TRINITY_DN18280_c0_g1_i1:64-618(+)